MLRAFNHLDKSSAVQGNLMPCTGILIYTILYMPSYHQFPQEGINHSLVTWLNTKVDYVLIPCTRSCLFCTECGHWGAGLHCLLRHVKQSVITLADFVAPMTTGGIIHHLLTVVYLIYQVMWSLKQIHALPTPGKLLYLVLWLSRNCKVRLTV